MASWEGGGGDCAIASSGVRFKNSKVHCALDRNKWIEPMQGGN